MFGLLISKLLHYFPMASIINDTTLFSFSLIFCYSILQYTILIVTYIHFPMESVDVHSDSGIFIPTIAYLFLVKTWFFEHWSNTCTTCTPLRHYTVQAVNHRVETNCMPLSHFRTLFLQLCDCTGTQCRRWSSQDQNNDGRQSLKRENINTVWKDTTSYPTLILSVLRTHP